MSMSKAKTKTKTVDAIQGELERAVFMSLYGSRTQRRRRLLALIILLLKHALRGLYYLWPVYIVVLVMSLSASPHSALPYLLALLPGVCLWGYVYIVGTRRDYVQCVRGRLLEKGFIRRLVLT